MTNRHTSAQGKDSDGTEFALQSTQSDAPILPISSIERLHAIRPDRVNWVFEQTSVFSKAGNHKTEHVFVVLVSYSRSPIAF